MNRLGPGAQRGWGVPLVVSPSQEGLDGKVVEWMEKVTDAQYGARP
ncbi:hypothetical protein [Archangium violaceum]